MCRKKGPVSFASVVFWLDRFYAGGSISDGTQSNMPLSCLPNIRRAGSEVTLRVKMHVSWFRVRVLVVLRCLPMHSKSLTKITGRCWRSMDRRENP